MPISAIDGYPASHWNEVREIITDAVATKGYHARLVSSAEAAGVIHKRIIQNLYANSKGSGVFDSILLIKEA